MLLDTDVDLKPATALVQQILSVARWHDDLQDVLPHAVRQPIVSCWHRYESSLRRVAPLLAEWDERHLAERVDQVLSELERLILDDARGRIDRVSLALRSYELEKRIAALQSEIARLAPMLTPMSSSLAERSAGTVLALITRRGKDRELRARIWALVRHQLSGAGGLALSSTTSLQSDFCYEQGVVGEEPGLRRLLFWNPDDRRQLLDERGQDLVTPSPLTMHHRYELQYYFLPERLAATSDRPVRASSGSLNVLMQLAWGLATLVPRKPILAESDDCFWMCAAPARSWCLGEQAARRRLRIAEDDAVFDHLSRLVLDDELANRLIVHQTIVADPSRGLGRWFSPAWRIPYQHRKRTRSSEECLWATAAFFGLPADEVPIDVALKEGPRNLERLPRLSADDLVRSSVPPASVVAANGREIPEGTEVQISDGDQPQHVRVTVRLPWQSVSSDLGELRVREGQVVLPLKLAFLSHAKEDKQVVEAVGTHLLSNGCLTWYDDKDLLPGDDWKRVIEQQIETCDFFLAFLSSRSVGKRGYVQRELRCAIEERDRRPFGTRFLIPILLDECEVPRELGIHDYLRLWESGAQELLLKSMDLRRR